MRQRGTVVLGAGALGLLTLAACASLTAPPGTWGTDQRFASAVTAVGWSAAGVLCVRRARLFGVLSLAVAVAGALCALIGAGWILQVETADRLGLVTLVALLPAAAVCFPSGTARAPYVAAALVVLGAFGVIAAVWGVNPWFVQTATLTAPLIVVAVVWWRIERGPVDERDAVLWFALGMGGSVLVVIPLAFLAHTILASAVAAFALLVGPASAVVGVRWPEVRPVRVVLVRSVSVVMAAVVTISLFLGVAALMELTSGRVPTLGELSFVAVLCAVVFAPIRRTLDDVSDRLMLGDRVDPVAAAARFADELSHSDDPVVALRGLREVLWLPYAALADAGGPIARSGTEPSEGTYRLPLQVGDHAVATLDIGLRPGETGPAPQDRAVLRMVVPALAQAVHARALAAALRESREHVVSAVEDDRRRLQHDLHDGLGPTLTGVAYASDAARNLVHSDPHEAEALLVALRSDIAAAIDDVRRLVDGLRPPVLDQVGLVPALRQHSTHLFTAEGTRLEVRLDVTPLPTLSAATEVAVYRIVTEALTNVARHARSPVADVSIGTSDGRLQVFVDDHGPNLEPWVPGVGLSSMRERAELLGGTFDVTAGSVRVEIPLT
ncbi:sensor histidine kinase [Cellulomonas sp. URHD0024]|uniref:sensor histidine kinase n=1 Tax=Cellulomonas sp. URHD0024 TaxID=1302620 RepID=UPI0004280F84|nr:sensor histidine kinase [Cellulomonas sp. URHD0024]